MAKTSDTDTLPNAEAVIKRFGGIRPMATKMGVPVTTVQGWKKRGVIPANRKNDIIKSAATHDVSLKGLKAFAASSTPAKQPVKKAVAEKSKTAAPKKPAVKSVQSKPTPVRKPATPKAAQTKPQAKVQPATPAAASPAQQPEAPKTIPVSELDKIRADSMRSAALTGTVIAGVVTVIGLTLFAPDQKTDAPQFDPARVAQLETRINSVESNLGQVNEQTQTALSLLGAGEQTSTSTQSVLGGGSVLETMAFLQAQIQEMGQTNPDVQAMAAQFETLSRNQETQGALQNGIQELQQSIASIQNQVQNLDQEVATTKGQMNNAVIGADRTDVQAAALLLALGQFRSAVNRNGPFEQDLEIMRGLIGDNPDLHAALDQMAPYAAKGVLSVDGLSQELRTLTGDIVTAKITGEDVSIKDRMVQRLNDLVTVSKDGENVIGQSEPYVELNRAQSELARGNIRSAMLEVQSIPDAHNNPEVQQWLAEAQATLNAQGVEVMIMQLVLDQIRAFQRGGLGALQNSVERAVQETVDEANRVLTNPALNLPPIQMPEMRFDKPDIPTIDMPKM